MELTKRERRVIIEWLSKVERFGICPDSNCDLCFKLFTLNVGSIDFECPCSAFGVDHVQRTAEEAIK